MSTTSIDTLKSWATREQVQSRTSVPRHIALSAVVILAAVLRFANLAALRYANHYYTAGAYRSRSRSAPRRSAMPAYLIAGGSSVV